MGRHVAGRLGIPLVISWHASLHEYAALRLQQVLGFLGPKASKLAGGTVRRLAYGFLAGFTVERQLFSLPTATGCRDR